MAAAVVERVPRFGNRQWQFRVQLNIDLDKMPIADASDKWSQDESLHVA